MESDKPENHEIFNKKYFIQPLTPIINKLEIGDLEMYRYPILRLITSFKLDDKPITKEEIEVFEGCFLFRGSMLLINLSNLYLVMTSNSSIQLSSDEFRLLISFPPNFNQKEKIKDLIQILKYHCISTRFTNSYQLSTVIDKGGFGVVYKAKNHCNMENGYGEIVAAKVISKSLINTEKNYVESFVILAIFDQ